MDYTIYIAVILFIVAMIALTKFNLHNRKKRNIKLKAEFLGLESIQELMCKSFSFDGSNKLTGTRNGKELGVYFLSDTSNSLELFTFINGVNWKSTKQMSAFNKKYKTENIMVDNKAGFCQKHIGNTNSWKPELSFNRLTEILETEFK